MTKKAGSSQTKQNQLIVRIEAIASRRLQWQPEHDKAVEGRNHLLANCLDLYYQVKKGTPDSVEFIDYMKGKLAVQGITLQKNINVMTLIVRYVFDPNCSTVFTWARVLRVAAKDKVKPEDFNEWVKSQGGIDKVSKNKGATEKTLKKRRELEKAEQQVDEWLKAQLDKPIGKTKKQSFHDSADTGTYVLLIGFTKADGTTSVLTNVPNCTEGMIKTAKKKVAEYFVENADKVKQAKLVSDCDDAMNEAIYSNSKSDKFEFYGIS